MRHTVLLVEDEAPIRELLADYFAKASWNIVEAESGEEALEQFHLQHIDLVVLDIMIPGMDGWQVCRSLREKYSVPILMLTAKSAEEDKLNGFDLGADDYITKPFSPKVLVARAASLIKRVEGQVSREDRRIAFGQTVIDNERRIVYVKGQEVAFSFTEYNLLMYMIIHRGKPVSREVLVDRIWGVDFIGELRVVDYHVKNIRRKLGEDAAAIQTLFRIGYKFDAPDEAAT